jgi:hypothetical protein
MNIDRTATAFTAAACVLVILSTLPAQGQAPKSPLEVLLEDIEKAAVPNGQALQEYKTPGSTFLMDISGTVTADGTETRFADLWKAKVKGIRVTSRATLRERILNVDTTTGIVKSELEVIQASSSLEASTAAFALAGIESDRMMAWYRSVEPQARLAARQGGRTLGELLAKTKRIPFDPKTSGMVGEQIADFLWGASGNWLTEHGLAPNPDGTIPVDRETLARILPNGTVVDKQHLGMVLQVDNIQGSRWQVTWQLGQSLREGDVVLMNREDVSKHAHCPSTLDQDLNLFQTLLRSTSMVSTALIYPPGSRTLPAGVPWEVDARALSLMLFRGVQFQTLEGSVWLSHAGETTARDWDDEKKNTGGQEFRAVHLGTDPAKAGDSRLKGIMKPGGNRVTTFTFTPSGKLMLVDDPKVPSKYVRSASFTGDLLSVDEENAGNFFTGVKVDGNVQMTAKFKQIRMWDGK